ncbi:MAG: acyltransferase [Bryobacterales bacterium]|nr:acyltransferase [Bryobacterales bacterium]
MRREERQQASLGSLSTPLLALNGLAILSVVVSHACGTGFIAMFWWTHRYLPVDVPNFSRIGSADYWLLRAMEQLTGFAVPAFLFVSGYFVAFASGRSQGTLWKYIVPRLQGLLVPYAIWATVLALANVAGKRRYTTWTFLKQILAGEATPAFYYVPLVCTLYLLSPFLLPLVRRRCRAVLVLLLVFDQAIRCLRYPVTLGVAPHWIQWLAGMTPSWFFPGNTFWFAAGIAGGLHGSALRGWVVRHRRLLAMALVPLYAAGLAEWELLRRYAGVDWINPWPTLLDSAFGGAVMLAALGAPDTQSRSQRLLGFLGRRSYGIFLTHPLGVHGTAKLIYHVAPGLLPHQFLLQPLLILTGIGLPLLLMHAVSRTRLRGYSRILFGR